MTDAIRKTLFEDYGLLPDIKLRQDHRGMMNDTWFVADDYVMTIFRKRPTSEVELLIGVVNKDKSGLLPKIVSNNKGSLSIIESKAAVLWERFPGSHYVGHDHSQKGAIPEEGHISIADAFWRLHASLSEHSHVAELLGQRIYTVPGAFDHHGVVFEDLPDCLKKPFIEEYLQTSSLPMRYPAFIHHDYERQNVLHASDGKVTGVVDADALMKGDLLFEYVHCMMNFMFSDPQYQPRYADYYMDALAKSGMVRNDEITLMPEMLRAYVAKDLIAYHVYDHPPKTDLSRLAEIYDISLKHADSYFSSLLVPAPRRPLNDPAKGDQKPCF